MQRLKKIVVSLTVLAMAVGVALPGVADAATSTKFKDNACSGLSQVGGSCSSGGSDIGRTISTILVWVSSIIGVVAVIMVMISGFKYITSGGDSQKIASAKSTLIYAIVGLIVVALAQVIVRFVIGQV